MSTIDGVWCAIAFVVVAADPRAYDGPSAVASARQDEVRISGDDRSGTAVEDLATRLPELRRASAPAEVAVARPRDGRALLITGGLFAAVGVALTATATAYDLASLAHDDLTMDDYDRTVVGLAAPAFYLVAMPLLGGGTQRNRFDAASRRIDEEGRTVPDARRGQFAAGISMAIVGSIAMVAAWPFEPYNVYTQWVTAPLAISGAMLAGAARGQRLGRRPRFVVAPHVSQRAAMLMISARI